MTPLNLQPILHLLLHEQRADGAFPGTASAIFGTLLSATILAELREYPLVRELCIRSLSYISRQQQADGSYRYWERGSDGSHARPYPPDMDDTALAAAAELLIDPSRFDGSKLAQFIKLLISAEVAEGGPYRTWLIENAADARWSGVDLGVNANIAFALSRIGIELPNLEQLFDDAISRAAYESRYYHLPLMLLFFISRSYRGAHAAEAVRYIGSLRHADGTWGTELETALALCALSNFEVDFLSYDSTVSQLLAAADTAPADPLYLERISNGDASYYANRSVSLSLIALAAHRYNQCVLNQSRKNREANDENHSAEFESFAYAEFISRCDAAGYRDVAKKHLHQLQSKAISKDIAAMPYHYWASLHDIRDRVPLESVRELSTAHICGWIGYGIVDAIMDGETAAEALPFALFCIRSFSEAYQSLFSDAPCEFFSDIMNRTEHAFAQEWEDRLTQLEESFMLSSLTKRTPVSWQKAFGHALPPLALLLLGGYAQGGSVYIHTVAFFQHFLHARQLHDDAHDFIEDLSAGRVTVIGKQLLARFMQLHPNHAAISFPADKLELRRIFWCDSFSELYGTIESSIADARAHLQQLPLADASYFESLLSGLLRAQQQARDERTRVLDFIRSY